MMYKRIMLTESDMKALDDGQGWYTHDDSVYVAGYLPESATDNAPFQLEVNGRVHDNWIHWADMPRWLQKKLE